jgi:hypothetical protein
MLQEHTFRVVAASEMGPRTQGCIKLATNPTLGRGASAKRPCLGGDGRFGKAPPPCVRVPHRA